MDIKYKIMRHRNTVALMWVKIYNGTVLIIAWYEQFYISK